MNNRHYEKFHGKKPSKVEPVLFDYPEGLILLGEAIAVEYRCSKKNGGGDGKKAVYRHEFEHPTILAMDKTERRQLYIIGEKLKVTSAGIEN